MPVPTPQLGAGSTPAGITPAGAGSPPTLAAASPVLFPDPLTGNPRTCRYIDPGTGQYDFAATGNAEGMGSVDQLVQIAISNADFSSIGVIDDSTPAQYAAVLSNALALFVNQGLLQIVSVDVSPFLVDGQRGVLKWRDLTLNSEPNTSPF